MNHERLKNLRKKINMSQQQIADSLGYTRAHYSHIEAGISNMPPGFYDRALSKMQHHVNNLAKLLEHESKMSHSSSDLSHYGS